jgi:predicted O-linked N-acetylglucosamine transferase (SPINDLY family)
MIEADGIDVLIDLAGHTGGNRLLVFARKPAPVQASWIGHPATTGMKAMDYRITDHFAEPEGMTEHLNTEALWRLPRIYGCYQGGRDRPPVISHPPADDNGYVTFGCFNNFVKVTAPALRAWKRILEAVPDARLLLEIASLAQPSHRVCVEEYLRAHGMPMDRIILEPRKPENQFVLYNRIDIALDPFPCTGGTTSMDTLWMGVPLVTLAGRQFVSRMSASLLNNVGAPELVAATENEYVAKAVALAGDRPRLRALRDHIRDTVERSPLMDKAAFARDMEDAYRGMWRRFCESGF